MAHTPTFTDADLTSLRAATSAPPETPPMTGLTDEQLEDAGRAFFRAIPIEWEPSRADYRAASLAFLATLPRIAGGVPAGWVLAPVKMTRQMAEAADRALIQMQSSQTIYAEALAASPPPPVKMLVDADWLRRKAEADPDGLDCEIGPPPPVSGEVDYFPDHEALSELVSLQDEFDALNGGGPGWWARWTRALDEAREIVRIEP